MHYVYSYVILEFQKSNLNNPEFSRVLPSGVLCKWKLINSDGYDILETHSYFTDLVGKL